MLDSSQNICTRIIQISSSKIIITYRMIFSSIFEFLVDIPSDIVRQFNHNISHSVMVPEESRDTRRSEKDVRDKTVTSMPKSFLAAEKVRKVRRVITVDPCVPWKPPSLTKDLQTFLGGPLPESIEKKTPSMVCSEEIEVSRSGLYPRISDFHSVEWHCVICSVSILFNINTPQGFPFERFKNISSPSLIIIV